MYPLLNRLHFFFNSQYHLYGSSLFQVGSPKSKDRASSGCSFCSARLTLSTASFTTSIMWNLSNVSSVSGNCSLTSLNRFTVEESLPSVVFGYEPTNSFNRHSFSEHHDHGLKYQGKATTSLVYMLATITHSI